MSALTTDGRRRLSRAARRAAEDRLIRLAGADPNLLPTKYDRTLAIMRGRTAQRRMRQAYLREASRRRHATNLSACPAWADRCEMRKLYAEAVRMSRSTGTPHEVDHVVPLQGRNVCGLHVPWNLRVVPRSVNRSKGAKMSHAT